MTPILRFDRSTILQLIIIAVVATVLGFFGNTSHHTRAFDTAYFRWQRDPTPENERLFREAQTKFLREKNILSLKASSVTFFIINAAVFSIRRLGRAAAISLFLAMTLTVAYAGLPDGSDPTGMVYGFGFSGTYQQWRMALLIVWFVTLVILGFALRWHCTASD